MNNEGSLPGQDEGGGLSDFGSRPGTGLASSGPTVETAAIRIGKAVFTLPRPNRHHNLIWWLSTLGIQSPQLHDQGFMLSDGSFVGRELAGRIALRNGQVEKLHSPPYLYSEDLFEGGRSLASAPDLRRLAGFQDTIARSDRTRDDLKANPPVSGGRGS